MLPGSVLKKTSASTQPNRLPWQPTLFISSAASAGVTTWIFFPCWPQHMVQKLVATSLPIPALPAALSTSSKDHFSGLFLILCWSPAVAPGNCKGQLDVCQADKRRRWSSHQLIPKIIVLTRPEVPGFWGATDHPLIPRRKLRPAKEWSLELPQRQF